MATAAVSTVTAKGAPRHAGTAAAPTPGSRAQPAKAQASRRVPGSPRESAPHMSGTVEHLVVGAGRVPAGPRDAPDELGPGDYVSYPGDVPHLCEALEPGTTCVMVMRHG